MGNFCFTVTENDSDDFTFWKNGHVLAEKHFKNDDFGTRGEGNQWAEFLIVQMKCCFPENLGHSDTVNHTACHHRENTSPLE